MFHQYIDCFLRYTCSDGLLTYSTPEISQQQVASLVLQNRCLDYLRRVQLSAVNKQPTTATNNVARRPRVNFHSIDDLASPAEHSMERSETDSGLGSSWSASVLTNTTHQHQNVNIKSSCDESASEDVSDENKENGVGGEETKGVSGGKKIRTTFTEQQKRSLDEYFQRNPYPDPRETEELSQQLVLPENVIKVLDFFQHQ